MRHRRWSWAALLLAVCVMAACTSDPPATSTGEPPEPTEPPKGAVFTPPPLDGVTEPAKGWFEASCAVDLEEMRRVRRGFAPGRSPEVMLLPREPNFVGGPIATSHSGPWEYLQRVPLVMYGPGFIREQGPVELDREVTLADLAPTYAELLGTEWPAEKPGRSISEALVPADERPTPPRLILTVVWDGGGWNVLDAWPGTWPTLARLRAAGTSVEGAIVGSSPSVTPSIHTTIGTGAFPKQHGIVGIYLRGPDGNIVSSFPAQTGRLIEVTTLADDFDRSLNNEPKVAMVGFKGWHLGMIGHGAEIEGGDRDHAVIINLSEQLTANETAYEMPEYLRSTPGLKRDLRTVDLDDGKLDNTWMGHEILNSPRERRDTPAWILYQTRLLDRLIARGDYGADDIPDLIYTNYKQIDEAGHNWNMLSREMPEEIRYSDAALDDLIEILDREVGEGQWVLSLTADHGQAPDPDIAKGWPIAVIPFGVDLAAEFGLEADELVEKTSPVGIWLRQDTMEANGITLEQIADFAIGYRLADNVPEDGNVPEAYADRAREPIFEAAFPAPAMGRVWACVNN